MTVRAIIEEAGKLTRGEQLELLEELRALVGGEEADVALTPAQAADLDRRIDEYRSDKAVMIDGDEAFARLRNRG